MLPANPRSGVRGLPTNPSPRSRSTGQAIPDREISHMSPSSRQGRQSANPHPRPSPQSRPSQGSELLTVNQTAQSRASSNRTELHLPRKSNDSVSSSGSSLLSRMKLGSTYTTGSSRTSLEDGYQSYLKEQPIKGDDRSIHVRQSGGSKEHPGSSHDEAQSTFAFNVGDGSAIWSRVATVASTLTVSVSKAWAANVPTYSGEETPPGQESRLTRAMKAYHLAKAKDPTDLPSWLFDESVRQRPTPTLTSDDDKYDYQTRQESPNYTPKPRGLRDVYNAAASTSSIPTLGSTQGRSRVNDMEEPSKVANRLKAIREAKRSALTANATPRHLSDQGDEYQTVSHNYDDKGKIDRRAPRQGLPPGPRRM